MNNSKEWVDQFEQLTGRKPTAAEFSLGKESGFDTTQLPALLGLEQAPSPQEQTDVAVAQSDSHLEPTQEDAQAPAESPMPEEATDLGQMMEAPSPVQPTDVEQPVEAQPAAGFQAVNPQAMPGQEQLSPQGQPVQPGYQNQAFPGYQQAGFAGQAATPKKGSPVLTLVLPIVVMVLAVLFAILSFTKLGLVFAILSFLTVVGAVVLVILSIKSKKSILSFVALGVSVLALLVSVGGAVVSSINNDTESSSSRVQDSDDDDSDSDSDSDSSVPDDSTDISDYSDNNYDFDWEQDDIDEQKVEKATVSEVIDEHGMATEARIDSDTLYLDYNAGSDYDDDNVSLAFEKEHDGTWVLSYVVGTFTATDIDTQGESYTSDWSKSDFDALAVGDISTGENGATWDSIKDKHGKPSEAKYEISKYDTDPATKELQVSYEDYDAPDDKAQDVSLHFVLQSDGKTYKLGYKYGSGAGITNS